MLLADGVFGIDGRSQGRQALCRLVDVEVLGARAPPRALISQGLVPTIQGVAVKQRLGVHPTRIVDDELEEGEADAIVKKLTKAESRRWVANVHLTFALRLQGL